MAYPPIEPRLNQPQYLAKATTRTRMLIIMLYLQASHVRAAGWLQQTVAFRSVFRKGVGTSHRSKHRVNPQLDGESTCGESPRPDSELARPRMPTESPMGTSLSAPS